MDAAASNAESTAIGLKSFTIRPSFCPDLPASTALMSVVFPEPRKPVTMRSGIPLFNKPPEKYFIFGHG